MAWLENFALEHSLEYRRDKTGNLVILKKASSGYEGRPTVILQSHVDMVAEKNSGTDFNFETDPIETYIDGNWVRAMGTTLGADDGIGMAAQLAALASDDLKHGPLECLFTVDEETGLTGAFGLGKDMLTGKYLINLDSEDEGEIFIGCAGGIDTVATFKYEYEPTPANQIFFRIDVNGLKGGHSGEDINKGLGNANKILAGFLKRLSKVCHVRIARFDGGNLRNAIPREAFAVFCVPVRSMPDMTDLFGQYEADIREEFSVTDPGLALTLSEMPDETETAGGEGSIALINALFGVPNGVLTMSPRMENLVETSTNLASVKFPSRGVIEVVSSQRSSAESSRDNAALSVEAVFQLAGAEVKHSDGYPGWAPDPSSRLLEITKQSYQHLFKKEPKARAIHAGLECGLFLKKYPELEMVSFGPTLRGVHSPDERLDIPSVDKFWKLLAEVLKKID